VTEGEGERKPMAAKKINNPDRELCLEIVTRLRESQIEAHKHRFGSMQSQYWAGRIKALDECYTELKGRGYAEKV
jgi:hypothetical protein